MRNNSLAIYAPDGNEADRFWVVPSVTYQSAFINCEGQAMDRREAFENLQAIDAFIPGAESFDEQVTSVTLEACGGDDDLVNLQAFPELQRLTLLSLGSVGSGLQYLKELAELTELDIANTDITEEGFIHLGSLTQLQILNLSFNSIEDDEINHLRKLTGLREFDLSGTGVTDACVEVLSELRGLNRLNLYETEVTESGIANLRTALPNAEIETGKLPPGHCRIV